MDPSQVLIRTAKGKEEVRTKAFDLSPSLRRLLLLVDETSTVAATLSRLAVLGDNVESGLNALLAEGYLAARPSDSDARARGPGDGSNRLPPLGSQPELGGPSRVLQDLDSLKLDLEKAKGFARYIVLGYLGPVGARRVERIDGARDTEQLQAELSELRRVLPELLPKRQARQAWDQLEPLMSPADAAPSWSQGPARRRDIVRATRAPREDLPPRSRETRGGIRFNSGRSQLAARILEFAQPLTNAAVGVEAAKRAVQVGIVCWNAAILPGNTGLATIAPTLRQIAAGDLRLERELFEIFAIMQARKHTHFDGDNRFVVDFSLTEDPEGLRLRVAAEPLGSLPGDRVAPGV